MSNLFLIYKTHVLACLLENIVDQEIKVNLINKLVLCGRAPADTNTYLCLYMCNLCVITVVRP